MTLLPVPILQNLNGDPNATMAGVDIASEGFTVVKDCIDVSTHGKDMFEMDPRSFGLDDAAT